MRQHVVHIVTAILAMVCRPEAHAQTVTITRAEIRPVAGMAKEDPSRFSVLLSVTGADQIRSVSIEFFSESPAGKVSLNVETVTEEDKHFILSSGARFPVEGDQVMFIVQPPKSYRPAMRQARITISTRSGSNSNTITTQW